MTTKNRIPVELTARQFEIAVLISQGMTNNVIAERLNVSVSTVKNTINGIYAELGLDHWASQYSARVSLAVAVKDNLITLSDKRRR